ncbi:MAG: hypothetical protein QM492_09140 [Rhodobacterales bacterium]
MSAYPTIALSFLIGMCLIWIAAKLWPEGNNWQNAILALAGAAFMGVVLWLILQVLIGLPSLAQTIDIPAILLGLLVAYGFQNAVHLIRERAKNKFK